MLFAFSVVSLSGQEVYLDEDFNSGMPSGFTLLNRDQNPVVTGDFTRDIPQIGWYAGNAEGSGGKAAMSTSHRTYDMDTDNWMITPRLSVASSEAWLRWDAKAIHYDLRDGYKVMVSTTGNDPADFTEIYAVEEEAYEWNHHLVSLQPYAGEDIYIAFVHDSRDRFLLAIDNVWVGELSDVLLEATNASRYFAGDVGSVPLSGTVRNYGAKVRLSDIVCVTPDNGESGMGLGGMDLQPDEEIGFEFDLPVSAGHVSCYRIEARLDDGQTVALLEDSVICSYYPRKLLVEEATGTWCTSCPTLIPFLNRLKDRFKDEAVFITSHNGDELTCAEYNAGVSPVNLPAIYYNRDKDNPQYYEQNVEILQAMLLTPTTAQVELSADWAGERLLHTSAKVVSAQDIDNSRGQYRLGYTVVEKTLQRDDLYQANGQATLTKHNEYYYMASPISPSLMFYHDLPWAAETAFTGVKGSLPEQIEAGTEYTCEYTMEVPDNVADMDNVVVVAFLMNTASGLLMNVDEASPWENPSSIGCPGSPAAVRMEVWPNGDGTCTALLPSDEPWRMEVFGPDGRMETAESGRGSSHRFVLTGKGCFFVRLTQAGASVTKKIITY